MNQLFAVMDAAVDGWLVVAVTLVAVVGSLVLMFVRRSSSKVEQGAAPVGQQPQEPSERRITRKEVAKHGTSDDLWVILRSKEHNQLRVYDLTAYVEEHPGGQAILNNAGGDSTKGFYGPQHPSKVFEMIEDFWIGVLAE